MKIFITIPCLLTGGTEYQTINLVRALKEDNHKVIVVCYYDYNELMVNLFESYGAEVVLLSPNNEDRLMGLKQVTFIFKHFKELIKYYKPDLIHVQYMAPGAIPILAARWYGVKNTLATVHQPYTEGHGKLSKVILRLCAKLCTRFIVVSKNAEVSWFGNASLYDPKIDLKKQAKHLTIYNAIDIDRIRNIKQKVITDNRKISAGIPNDTFVFGVVSRLRHEKGIDILIDAFARLAQEKDNVHLHIVGAGPDSQQLFDKAIELKVQRKVSFFGEANWETAMQEMALMDVVVVPSRFEGFGLTAAEALAMGKPVIASNVFGLKEVVADQHTGYLFENGQFLDLYFKMKMICEDIESYRHFEVNTQRFVKQFGLPVFFNKVKSLHTLI